MNHHVEKDKKTIIQSQNVVVQMLKLILLITAVTQLLFVH